MIPVGINGSYPPQPVYGTFYPQSSQDSAKGSEIDDSEEISCSLVLNSNGLVSPFDRIKRCSTISHESGYYTDIKTSEPPKSFSIHHQAPFSEFEVKRLFDFMEEETSKVEHRIQEMADEEDHFDASATVVTINAEPGDYDNISIGNTVEEEAKEYQSAFGTLCSVKQRVLELRNTLESSCAKLDRLVGMGEYISLNSQEMKKLVKDKTQKQREFEGRLNTCLDDIGNQMDAIRRKNSIIIDGVRHLRYHPDSITGDETVCWLPWVHGILFMALVGVLLGMYKWSNSSNQWIVSLRLVRSPLLIILVLYLYGINLKVWIRNEINYISIFDHHPNGIPTPKYIFNVAGILTFITSVLIIGLTVASPFSVVLPIKIIPVVLWLILAAFLFNPLRIFQRRVRFNFILVCVHILLAPFVFVYFSDFFLADQFNSTVAVFLDVQYFLCYLVSGSWSGEEANTKICTSSGNGIRPIISFLPALWRLLQCLRCYYDTRSVKHLVNAGKYFTTFPVIVFATIYATVHSAGEVVNGKIVWVIVLWGVAALVHAVYTFLWDVCCDWGLWNIKNCGIFQRRLLYRYKVTYWVAIVLDLMLRFLWTMKLTLAIVWEVDSDLIYTGECGVAIACVV